MASISFLLQCCFWLLSQISLKMPACSWVMVVLSLLSNDADGNLSIFVFYSHFYISQYRLSPKNKHECFIFP